MQTDIDIGSLVFLMKGRKMRPVKLVIHDEIGEHVCSLSPKYHCDSDTVYFLLDYDPFTREMDTRDITRICNKVGWEQRLLIKNSNDYRFCTWVIQKFECKPEALYLHIWNYKTLYFKI